MDPHVSNQRARDAADKPQSFRGFEVAISSVIIYDDPPAAKRLAAEIGSEAKHASAKHPESAWKSFSVVPLPEGWEELISEDYPPA